MQCSKGSNYTTQYDIDNLVELYTQAVEYYNSTQQAEKQRYYQLKLQNLLESPSMQKVYENNSETLEPEVVCNDEVVVKIYDKSVTSPLY